MVNRVLRLGLSLLLALIIFGLMQGFLVRVISTQASRLSAMATLDRDLEPVIVKGVFSGAPLNQLFVYHQVGAVLQKIPFQIEEVTTAGAYTVTEDGLMDNNDEIVFMASDLGDEATTPLTVSLPITPFWYKIEVTDPISPTKKGWVYIVRSSVLTAGNTVDYANFIAASQRVSTTNYAFGWDTDNEHAGLEYMSLFGGSDILDRTKVRVKYTFIVPFTLTENTLPKPALTLIKDGSVRVIVSRGAATTFAYASLIQTITPIDFTSFPGTLNEVRLSTDLTNTVTDTFYNENVPGGVTIDGTPDIVPTTLLKPWRQISLNSGTVIQAVDLGGLGGTLRHYYKDNSAFDGTDTGDGRVYGDSGLKIVNPTSKIFTVESVQYILPGKQGNRGNEFYNNIFKQPLLISVLIEPRQKVHLPVILKGP